MLQWNTFDGTVMNTDTYSFERNTQDLEYIFCAKFKNEQDSNRFTNFLLICKKVHLLSFSK